MAEKNKKLAAANKAVEAAKDSVTAANNALAAAKSDTVSTYSALNAANSTLKSVTANYNSVKRNYDTAESNLKKATDKLAELEAALEKAKTEGTETTKKCGLEEKTKALAFINTGGEENPLYYKFDGDGLALVISVKEKDGFQKIIKSEISTKWSESIIMAETEDIGLIAVELYYEVPGFGESSTSLDFPAEITRPAILQSRLKTVLTNFKGVDETVIAVNPAVVADAQQKVDDQEEIVEERQTAFDNATLDLNDAQGLVDDAEAAVATAKATHNTAVAAFKTAQGKVQTAQGALTSAQGEVTRIEGEIDDINASVAKVNEYKNLSITDNIAVTDADFTLGDWDSDYTINGNGFVIKYPDGANGNLTGVSKGVINNLGVVNGKIATTNAGTLKIAFETTDGKNYDIYDASGAHDASPMNGALAYRARPYFGVAIKADGTFGTLDKKTADNTVYKAEWTDARTKKTTTFYTNASATDLSYNPAKNKVNTFAYVVDTDLNTTDRLTKATNVVANGICKNAKFTDNVAEGNDGYIYIPTEFKAENLTYDRSFKSSMYATVCLPFEVSAEILKAKGVAKKMQFSNVETATNTYWFRYQGDNEAMRANEPYVLKFDNGFGGGNVFANLTDIDIAATGSIDRFAVAPSNPGTGAEFLGVFVSTNATQLAEGGNLYGFGDGKFRPMTVSESNKCLPFRTYVRTSSTSNVPAVTFSIGELDEDGNIVNGDETAISTTEADAFSVKGINGALVITSDKAQKVNVYTIGGSLVKATNVEAGTVTVPVAAGVYVVNGKKVFVK